MHLCIYIRERHSAIVFDWNLIVVVQVTKNKALVSLFQYVLLMHFCIALQKYKLNSKLLQKLKDIFVISIKVIGY